MGRNGLILVFGGRPEGSQGDCGVRKFMMGMLESE